jgi:hypothetical protein
MWLLLKPPIDWEKANGNERPLELGLPDLRCLMRTERVGGGGRATTNIQSA